MEENVWSLLLFSPDNIWSFGTCLKVVLLRPEPQWGFQIQVIVILRDGNVIVLLRRGLEGSVGNGVVRLCSKGELRSTDFCLSPYCSVPWVRATTQNHINCTVWISMMPAKYMYYHQILIL